MFITMEGVEGSGKTTQAGMLANWLEEQNVSYMLTKEPGTIFSKECQEIRKLLLSPENNLDARAELFLYLADRAQHVGSFILPALNDKKWVISDRFSYSTWAYQGYGRGHRFIDNGKWFFQALTTAAYNITPDIAFILDLPVEIGLKRAKSSNIEFVGGDRMEREEIDFHQVLREGFLEIAREKSDHCVVLNAEKSVEELHEEIKEIIKERF